MDPIRQRRADKYFLTNIVVNNEQVLSEEHPERKEEVVRILRRILESNSRRGDPSKALLTRLFPLIPGEFTSTPLSDKQTIVNELLSKLDTPEDEPNENDNTQPDETGGGTVRDQGTPVGGPPPGWGVFLPVIPNRGEVPPKPLLLLRRKKLEGLSSEIILDKLLNEQEELVRKKAVNDQPTLSYARKHLSEMSGNNLPLPEDTSDEWIWYLYQSVLQTVLNEKSKPSTVTGRTKSHVDLSRDSDLSHDESVSSSESDLDTYAPKKKFSLSSYKTKSKKRKRAKKRKKKRKKRRVRDSSPSSDSSSSSLDDAEPNGRRVKPTSYSSTHYDKLRHFRETYEQYCDEGRPGGCPRTTLLTSLPRTLLVQAMSLLIKPRGLRTSFRRHHRWSTLAPGQTRSMTCRMSSRSCVLNAMRSCRVTNGGWQACHELKRPGQRKKHVR